jgi:hypothetical protein
VDERDDPHRRRRHHGLVEPSISAKNLAEDLVQPVRARAIKPDGERQVLAYRLQRSVLRRTGFTRFPEVIDHRIDLAPPIWPEHHRGLRGHPLHQASVCSPFRVSLWPRPYLLATGTRRIRPRYFRSSPGARARLPLDEDAPDVRRLQRCGVGPIMTVPWPAEAMTSEEDRCLLARGGPLRRLDAVVRVGRNNILAAKSAERRESQQQRDQEPLHALTSFIS